MRILIDIGHPGHVHLFRLFAIKMIENGHQVLFTCRQKEFEIELLKSAGLPYISFGQHYKTKRGKVWGLVKFDILEIIQGMKFKPDLFLSHGSFYAAHAAWILRVPHISLEDTGNMEQVRLYLPFTKIVLTSSFFHKNLGQKQINYNSFHELAYLHPNHFKPDKSIFKTLNQRKDKSYVIIRFVSWNATHDAGQKGLNVKQKINLVKQISEKHRVFISAERDLPLELAPFQINIPPEKMHDVLAYATMFIGEGATMASESAILGTPSIYINSMEAGTIDEQERCGLLFHFRNGDGVIEKVIKLLADNNLKKKWLKRKLVFLRDKIDLTSFLIWFIENYPESVKTIKQDQSYQNNFL